MIAKMKNVERNRRKQVDRWIKTAADDERPESDTVIHITKMTREVAVDRRTMWDKNMTETLTMTARVAGMENSEIEETVISVLGTVVENVTDTAMDVMTILIASDDDDDAARNAPCLVSPPKDETVYSHCAQFLRENII